MNARARMLAEESISKVLFKLSVPATIGMVVQALYSLVDTIFVGRALGVESVQGIAGITIAFPIQMIIMGVALTIGIGSASIISRSLGSKDYKRADIALGNAISAILALSILITVLGSIYIIPLLKLFGATETILPFAFDYTRIILYGTIVFAFSMTVNNIVRAEGNAKVAMLTMLISAGLNIILDPIFIFGLDMGIEGAAIATVISQAISAIYLVHYFSSGMSGLNFHASNLIPHSDVFKETVTIGASSFARSASSSLMIIVINNALAIYGGDIPIAVFGVVNRLFMFTFMPMIGIVQGLQPIVGFNYGAKNFDRVISSTLLAIKVTTVISMAGFLLLFLFPSQLFSIFTTDQQLIDAGTSATRIMVLAVPFVGFQIVGASIYQTLGKARPAFILSISRQVLFLIPLVLILPRFFQLEGIWIAFPISDGLSFLVTFVMLAKEYSAFKSTSA
ncbi:MATE family efflux transporter [Methanococcoides sp. AM1]|uniref:MATE family efflux transporter n=1 Tax=Methanococcoides sp. AM1 TaxID=1201011 RepID=UPI001083F749|nr:MATE family efflux transporter [Methanococcoides sp. AM1]